MPMMAPSRGMSFMRLRLSLRAPAPEKRRYTSFVEAATNPLHKSQVYISRSLNPYLNLSIEHFLLQKTPPNSTVLFLYTNRPCIVIGRNQNPWLEVNLGLLAQPQADIGQVSLVRRRSGGGTVFHDEGNVNYSVICPTEAFHRDKHAEMVVRALHKLGVDRAKVNERHDIILIPDANHREGAKPLKVSGSAYKLTRLRSLHHGTCLLSSPNIKSISQYLRSPAEPFIKARGVDSVSSPIANVNVSNDVFEDAVVSEFSELYGIGEPILLTETAQDQTDIAKGLHELMSLDWIYSQTPQFTFSSHKTADDSRDRPPLPNYLPTDLVASFTARNGIITEADLHYGRGVQRINLKDNLMNKNLHEIDDWRQLLKMDHTQAVAKWFTELFGSSQKMFQS